VAAYLASMAVTHARATLRRRLAAIGRAHRMKGLPWDASHPAIRDTLAGIARRHGTPPRRAAALGTAELRRLVATCDGGLAASATGHCCCWASPPPCAAPSWWRSSAST
jgi:hypothetical protein